MVRETSVNYNQLYLKKAQKATVILRLIPAILLIGISGSIAENRATEKSDIDLFIVCKSGRLFSCRFFAKLLLLSIGWARRNHDPNPSGKICLNYFLSEKSLDFKPHNQRVISFHRHSIILFSRGGILAELIRANSWLKPDFQLKYHRCHHLSYYQNRLGNLFEKWLKKYQSHLIESDPLTSEYPNQIIYNDLELRFHPPKEDSL